MKKDNFLCKSISSSIDLHKLHYSDYKLKIIGRSIQRKKTNVYTNTGSSRDDE